MKIGVIVAMGKELKLLLHLIENRKTTNVDGYDFHCGEIGHHTVFVMQCGIGKVNAAVGTYVLINNYHPDLVINTGVAGGADACVRQMDIVVCENIAYHDVWCGPGTSYGEAAGCPLYFNSDAESIKKIKHVVAGEMVKYGLICSGDKFISRKDEISIIKGNFPQALAVDMESASIAQVCFKEHTGVLVVRVISDNPDNADDNVEQYDNFWDVAPEHTFKVLTDILNAL